MPRARLIVMLVFALLLQAAGARAQSPRAGDGPRPFDFPTFSQRLLQTQPLMAERPTHFIVMVDVSASVGNLMLGSWRSGIYEPLLESFMVGGDRVSVVPFGLHAWFDDARLGESYTRPQRAHIYTGTFPTTVKPPQAKGTDIYGSMAEVLDRADREGWTRKENLVFVVVTDDQIEEASEKANRRFQQLRASLLASASDVMRMSWAGPRGRRDYTIMVFTNPFPDARKLASPRNEQLEQEKAAPGGGGGNSGGGGGSAPAGGSPAVEGSPSAEVSPSPSPSPAEEASGFWPPPWWFWAVLGAGLVALVVALSRGPKGVRLTIDGTPGKLKPGDRPLEVRSAAGDVCGELRLKAGGVVFHARPPFEIEGASPNVPKPRPASGRASSPAAIIDPFLAVGRNGAFETYSLELVRKGAASTSWSDAPVAAADTRARVEVAVAELAGDGPKRTERPARVGSKGGSTP